VHPEQAAVHALLMAARFLLAYGDCNFSVYHRSEITRCDYSAVRLMADKAHSSVFVRASAIVALFRSFTLWTTKKFSTEYPLLSPN
jgi:hypothetical protein